MIIPIRCFACGKPIGHLYDKYLEKVKKGDDPGKALDSLDIDRYCCRGVFIGHVDLIDVASEFKKS